MLGFNALDPSACAVGRPFRWSTLALPNRSLAKDEKTTGMAISKDSRREILTSNRLHEKDSGSADVQIALLTANIKQLTEHMKAHRKDFHSRRGLILMVGRRNKLLRYLSRSAHDRYIAITDKLGLRR